MGTEPQLKKHYVFGFCYLKKKKERERELKEMEIPHKMVKGLICKGTNGGRERARRRKWDQSDTFLFLFWVEFLWGLRGTSILWMGWSVLFL